VCSHAQTRKHLPKNYQNLGLDYDDKFLPSIGNEVLKSIIAQFDAAELITQREVVGGSLHISAVASDERLRQVASWIREDFLARAGEFNLKLEDVSITHLTFGKVWFY
jgi:prohibitin 1